MFLGRVQYLRKAFGLQIKFMISQGNCVIPHFAHKIQFKGFFPGQHMEKRTHEKVSPVKDQDRAFALIFYLFNHCGDSGVSANGFIV